MVLETVLLTVHDHCLPLSSQTAYPCPNVLTAFHQSPMTPHRPTSAADDNIGADRQSAMSAATDGDSGALDAACQAWRSDPEARANWHAYHLIGDVLRSTELASLPAHDAAFLNRLRQSLAAEPVVLAPVPKLMSPQRRQASGWLVPAAVAAGFVVVAGVLVVSRVSLPTGSPTAPQASETMAAAPSPSGVMNVGAGAVFAAPGTVRVQQDDAALIRDPRLDEFLRAHQAARGGMAVAVPGSALRRVDTPLPSGAAR